MAWTTRGLPILSLGAGLLLRLGLIAARAGEPPELFEYDTLARNLLAGAGYVCPHLGVPYLSYYAGLPYVGLTALLYALAPPGFTAVLVAQAVLSTLTGALACWIGRRLRDAATGALAAALVAFHPPLVYCDTHKLHPLGLDALLTAAAFAGALWLARAPGPKRALAAGLLLGAGVLQRGSLLAFVPLAGLWLWTVLGGAGGRRRTAILGAWLAGIALAVAPWVVRNARLHGAPLLLTTNGEHFWIGNAPSSLGSALLPDGRRVLDAMPAGLRRELDRGGELAQERAFWRAGLAHARAHPLAFARGVLRKLVSFWTFAPQSGILYPPLYRTLYRLYYAAVALLAAWGLAGLLEGPDPGARRGAWLMLALFAAVSAVHAVFYVELRHRWALEPLLLVLAAAGALHGLRAAGGLRSARPAP